MQIVVNVDTKYFKENMNLSNFGGKNSLIEIIVTNKYLLKNKIPWLPTMGEFHFSRYPEDLWEKEILKIKFGGIQIIATYLFWIYHEEIEGEFDWSGNKNVRKFVELCKKHDMFVFLRVGPWAHGECRNGGFPDWLLQKGCNLRTDDPLYLEYVERWYREIAKQVDGLYFEQDGPIIGIQLENELYNNKEHIITLKKIANKVGLRAPIYTVTGWGPKGGASFPEGEVIPVFGGYPEAPWEQHTKELPPNPNFFFTYLRNDTGIGNDLLSSSNDVLSDDQAVFNYPFWTCELGGGVQKTYHRRPYINPDDVGAIALVKLGSGCTLLGYYMYHGGRHAIGKLSTLQESKDTGYPNDYPVISYDFQAPLGEFGEVRRHYHILRNLHMFVQDFGDILAPMEMYLPKLVPANRFDITTPRVAVRSNGKSGFVFFNNYQRNPKLSNIEKLQVKIQLPEKVLTVPFQPFTLETDAYFFLPFNFNVGGFKIVYATAQPLCKLYNEKDGELIYVFKKCKGLEAEYVFEGDITDSIVSYKEFSNVCNIGGSSYTKISNVQFGIEKSILLKHKESDKNLRIITLDQMQAEKMWKVKISSQERILICPTHNIFVKDDTIHIFGENPEGYFYIYPAYEDDKIEFDVNLRAEMVAENLYRISFWFEEIKTDVKWYEEEFVKNEFDRFLYADVNRKGNVKQFKLRYKILGNKEDLDDLLLEIEYVGDVIQAFVDNKLVNDDFFDGFNRFHLSLKELNFPEEIIIKMSAISKFHDIYLQKVPNYEDNDMVAAIKSTKLIPVYKREIKFIKKGDDKCAKSTSDSF